MTHRLGPATARRDRARRDPEAWRIVHASGVVCLGGLDGSGAPLGVPVANVAGNDAYLARLVSDHSRGYRSEARCLVHRGLVSALIDAGVRRVWTDAALTVPVGLQLFQRRLGYECVTFRLHQEPR